MHERHRLHCSARTTVGIEADSIGEDVDIVLDRACHLITDGNGAGISTSNTIFTIFLSFSYDVTASDGDIATRAISTCTDTGRK